MACRDCGPAPPALPAEGRTFACPLDGAHVEIVVRGEVTPRNMPLVRQYLSFVYDVLDAASQPPEGTT